MVVSNPMCSFPAAGWASDRRPCLGGVWDIITYGEAWLWGLVMGKLGAHMFFQSPYVFFPALDRRRFVGGVRGIITYGETWLW